MSDYDITTLILSEHEAFRRDFTALEQLTEDGELKQAWTALADRLEVHAAGEESVLYPRLVRAADVGPQESEHAVRDHNEIRDSVRAVSAQQVGTDAW